MVLPNEYLEGGEGAVASYDYTDIAEGTGITNFNCFKYGTSGAVTYGLTTITPYSSTIETSAALTDSWTKVIDMDFDLSSFNFPKEVYGTAILSVPMALGSSNVNSGAITARIRKWDGTTETDIAVAYGTETRNSPLTSIHIIKIPVTTSTHFKKGETLRLTIEGWGKTNIIGGGSFLCIGHDPQNRASFYFTAPTTTPTKLEFHCPFKILN